MKTTENTNFEAVLPVPLYRAEKNTYLNEGQKSTVL